MITVNWVFKYISAPNINRDDVVWCEADTKCKNKYIKPLTNHAYHHKSVLHPLSWSCTERATMVVKAYG